MPLPLPDPQLPGEPKDALQSIQRNFEALATAQGGPTYLTTLPAEPFEGQEIYFAADPANSVIWHLRYRSAARSGGGAWEFIGGSPLFAGPSGDRTTSTSLTYVTITDGPTITVPRTGKYLVTIELRASYERSGADGSLGGQGYSVGVRANASATEEFLYGVMIDNFESDNVARTKAMTYSTSDNLETRAKVDQFDEEVRFTQATLSLTPIYLNPA